MGEANSLLNKGTIKDVSALDACLNDNNAKCVRVFAMLQQSCIRDTLDEVMACYQLDVDLDHHSVRTDQWSHNGVSV